MAYKGTTGGQMGITYIGKTGKKRRPQRFYGAHLAGPVKITKADGTVEYQEARSPQELSDFLEKESKKPAPVVFGHAPKDNEPQWPATQKQKEYMDMLGLSYPINVKKHEAQKLISDHLKKK